MQKNQQSLGLYSSMVMYSWTRVPMCCLCLVFHSFHSTSSVCQLNKVTWHKSHRQQIVVLVTQDTVLYVVLVLWAIVSCARAGLEVIPNMYVERRLCTERELRMLIEIERQTGREGERETERVCYLCYPKCRETFSYFMIHFPFLVLFLSCPLSLSLSAVSLFVLLSFSTLKQ